MVKLKKRRSKKWDPTKRFNGLTREEYVRLPYKGYMSEEGWKNLIDKLLGREDEPEDEVEVSEFGETGEAVLPLLPGDGTEDEDGTLSKMEESG